MTHNADTHKKCTKCKEVKERGEFYKNKTNKDKLSGACKICFIIKSREWIKNNPERIKGYRQHITPEYSKKWREDNKDKIKRYREDNEEYYKEYHKEWKKKNKAKIEGYKIKHNLKNSREITKTKLAMAFIKTIGKVAK